MHRLLSKASFNDAFFKAVYVVAAAAAAAVVVAAARHL